MTFFWGVHHNNFNIHDLKTIGFLHLIVIWKLLHILYIQTTLINEHLHEWINWNVKVASRDEGDVEKEVTVQHNTLLKRSISRLMVVSCGAK